MFSEPASSNKGAPLEGPGRIGVVVVGQFNRLRLNWRFPVPEGGSYRFNQQFTVKRIQAREKSEIVVIFQSAVQQSELGERLQFLCNNGFLWVSKQHGGREIQQRRIFHLCRRR